MLTPKEIKQAIKIMDETPLSVKLTTIKLMADEEVEIAGDVFIHMQPFDCLKDEVEQKLIAQYAYLRSV